jgi:predicted nucleic acid-binding protein
MMLVLDTNVISELMKAKPDPQVITWLDSQPSNSVWTTSVSVFEISFGLNSLPDGKRKRVLQDAFEAMLTEELRYHILDFDRAAAKCAVEILAKLHGLGRPVKLRDLQIAGIVSVRHAILATRNSKHFHDFNISLLNPWSVW